MIDYNTLEEIDLDEIHGCFLESFSDYEVDMDIPFPHFKKMLNRRGYVPDHSIGAFDDGELVGFVLNGIRDWYGRKTAYDTGTGVIPEYRRKGISTQILKELKIKLKEKDVEQYLLEVIKDNKAGFELYKDLGFKITRDFICYHHLEPEKLQSYDEDKHLIVSEIDSLRWGEIEKFWDFRPSWQNSKDSLLVYPEEYKVVIFKDDEILGYGVINKTTGNIPQIAVSKSYRRENIGSRIISGLYEGNHDKLSVLNVDSCSQSANRFLKSLGFDQMTEQYEMKLEL